MLFWMVVILGHRRQRNFERVFFFLCLALFLFYSGSLLALNSQIYYADPPPLLTTFAWTMLSLGLIFVPPLVAHLHWEYAETRALLPSVAKKRLWLAAVYAPALYFVLRGYKGVVSGAHFDFLTPALSFGRAFEEWFVIALVVSAYWEMRFAAVSPDKRQSSFHRVVGLILSSASVIILVRVAASPNTHQEYVSSGLALLPILPLGALIYYVQRFNFLQIGRQQNLLYAVTVTFFALIYLSLIRRVSLWLEPVVPPEASAAILLFVLVIFMEPLQRALGRRLKKTAQQEIDQAQRIVAAIQATARQGNSQRLGPFAGEVLKEKLELAEVQLALTGAPNGTGNDGFGKRDARWIFPIERDGRNWGNLYVRPHGAMLSGETRAALEHVCEQLPAAFDLCQLIEEKLRLERELAEQERMAVLGQMAASISHNLKNPLGSIKTILQVQLESPEMPEAMKAETQMVLGEISRLSNKLGQLLQFSRPAVLAGSSMDCSAKTVLNEVSAVMRPEAEWKRIALTIVATEEMLVAASREGVSDIVSNLVVNALDATGRGGKVAVELARRDGQALIQVEDDGEGIPTELRERVMQPFFTTKTQGTGLGLAIVARRVNEAGGKLELESPAANGRGTRFKVWLPLREGEK